METTIRINSDNLSADIIEAIKKMFPHKNIEITINPADETEYILNNPEYAQELKERIEEYEIKQKTIVIKADELL
ncbi:MAG TPA: hypothetical protein VGP55_10100 [Chitinophagaceae bacterium]|nr:hypothetical protein [Chitinophagaceae bacterium]